MSLLWGLLEELSQLPILIRRRLKVLFTEKREPGHSKLSRNKAVPSYFILGHFCGLMVSLLGTLHGSSLQQFGFIYFCLHMTKGGYSKLLNCHVLNSRGQLQKMGCWLSKHMLLTLDPINMGPGATRHSSQGLSRSCVMLLWLKKKSVDFKTLASPPVLELSIGSSAVGILMSEETEQVEELVEGVSGQPRKRHSSLPSIFHCQSSVTGPIQMQGGLGSSAYPQAQD